ncbi:hypothetical protein NE237_029414 [Protea cynaroides]|uniref:RRM domain-containing protein n=1 Tax=Protea cynaroides TaxID=273540 RepID=A0A9Q0GR59_9MAGN|nr:hypothetical protein NE237_029414 [Protea cynaroides]
MATSQQRCVFVGNIPYDATEEQLIQICEEVGPVVSFRLVIDRETGKPKGYGFCEYKDEETALSARRNLQGYEINGRQLRVDFAENDKSADRNREQGRGGPGLASNVDARKQLGGPAILGDSALHQPIGLPQAATAASVMVRALGDVQTAGMSSNQNGLLANSGLGNDPLTHYLAKMSRNQLYEIMSEIKVMATNNKELARQLLLTSPQLPKALFQAQIMLGMVTPQVLQMPNIRQSPGSLPLPQLQDGKQGLQSALRPPIPGQIPLMQNNMQIGLMSRLQESQVPTLPQSALVNSQLSLPLQQVPIRPRFQHSSHAQNQVLVKSSVPGQSGVSTVPSIRTQPYSGLSIPPQTPALGTSTALKQQIQPPMVQLPRLVGAVNLGHSTQLLHPDAALINPSLLPRPLSQPSFQPGPSTLPSGPDTVHRDAERSALATEDGTWAPRSSNYSNLPSGLPEQTSMVTDTSEGMNRPPKLARLEDGRRDSLGVGSVKTSATGSLSANQASSTAKAQESEKQVPQQLQLPPEVESALLQQVMSLTPEQLSSLPPEQQQQVIQLQQMLRPSQVVADVGRLCVQQDSQDSQGLPKVSVIPADTQLWQQLWSRPLSG